MTLMVATLVATGCGDHRPDDGAVDPTLTAIDSAGVQVVSFDLDALPIVHAVAPEPTWFVGQGAGGGLDLDLFRVVGVTPLRDGRVAIAEGSTQQVWLVDPDAKQVHRLGGQGDGPTEFQGLSSVHFRPGAGLVVHDGRRSRLATLDLQGNLVSEQSVPPMGPPGSAPHVVVDGQGTRYAALVASMPSGDQMGVQRPDGVLLRLDDPPDTVARLRGREIFRSDVGLGIVLFGASTALAAADAGVWVGDSEHPRVELRSSTGAPITVVRWSSDRPRQVTQADKDEFWQRLDDAAGDEQPRPSAGMRDVLPFADIHPAFGRLLAAGGGAGPGDLWIGPAADPAADLLREQTLQVPPPEEWVVVRFTAGRAARVSLPAGLRPLAVYDDHLFGVHIDALGVETVRSHALDWSAFPPPGD